MKGSAFDASQDFIIQTVLPTLLSQRCVRSLEQQQKGSVHILFGSSALNFQANRVIQGRDAGGVFGSALSTDGSIIPNRLFVGAPRANNAKGKVYSVTNAAAVSELPALKIMQNRVIDLVIHGSTTIGRLFNSWDLSPSVLCNLGLRKMSRLCPVELLKS